MSDRVYGALFLCTGNSIRSAIGECILARRGAGRFASYSAGSHPAGQIHPGALRLLAEHRHDTRRLRSKSWDEFAGPRAPALDFVFTVCDSAAAEACPVWSGGPLVAHWGVEDPTGFGFTPAQREAAFRRVYDRLDDWIERFVALPIERLDRGELEAQLAAIPASAARNRGDS